jgi:hypothetical protein
MRRTYFVAATLLALTVFCAQMGTTERGGLRRIATIDFFYPNGEGLF